MARLVRAVAVVADLQVIAFPAVAAAFIRSHEDSVST